MNFSINPHASCWIFGLIARWPSRTRTFRFRSFVASWIGASTIINANSAGGTGDRCQRHRIMAAKPSCAVCTGEAQHIFRFGLWSASSFLFDFEPRGVAVASHLVWLVVKHLKAVAVRPALLLSLLACYASNRLVCSDSARADLSKRRCGRQKAIPGRGGSASQPSRREAGSSFIYPSEHFIHTGLAGNFRNSGRSQQMVKIGDARSLAAGPAKREDGALFRS